jgi:cephalosporin hydroxylase
MKTIRPLAWGIAMSLAATSACKREPRLATPRLGELAKVATKTDKGPHRHNYVEIYERFMFQWKHDPIKIFEIGIEDGGSLVMWQEYFPKASIFGLDIEDKSALANVRVKTIVGDQSKRDQLQNAMKISGGDIDILVDDGGHTMEQQQVSLGYLFKFVRPGGYYVLEDIHTSIPAIRPGYGVESDGSNSTLRMIQNYMQSAPPAFKSKYMLPEEMKYLDEHVEFANLHYRASSRSIFCIFKKKSH